MTKSVAACLAIFAAVGSIAPVHAHHSNSLFDMSTHVWLTGTVVRYEPINPHAIIELEEVTKDGRIRRWIVEGPRLGRLELLGVEGDFVEIGDMVKVCGFFAKADTFRDSRVHGHVVIPPDGKKWQWGPYGNLERCVDRDEWHDIETGSNPLRDNTQ